MPNFPPITRQSLLENKGTPALNRPRLWTTLDTAQHEQAASSGKILTCPKCDAVGTYKAHGADCHGGGHRRWLCKFCGYFRGAGNMGPQGEYEGQCFPHVSGVWR